MTSRSEWCISRQRSWGVPIPILVDADNKPIIRSDFLDHAIRVLDERGSDHWWTGPVLDFVPPSHLNDPEVDKWTKGRDTLDVWFDSGSAWTSIQESSDDTAEKPLADVILEGSDQHRGWFQSTLLTRLISTSKASPVARNIVSHGFIVDESGRKMSKSDGNGVSPIDVIHGDKVGLGSQEADAMSADVQKSPPYGADALRIWAASVDYSRDVAFGPTSMAQASELLRKLRSVLRFMLANTSGSPSLNDPALEHDHVSPF